MPQIRFYALNPDLTAVLERVDPASELIFVLAGNYEAANFSLAKKTFANWHEIPGLGVATSHSSISCNSYLVHRPGIDLSLRRIGAGSGARICIDQLLNPDTVTFTPGGRFDEETVLSGRVATVSSSTEAVELMKRFRSAVRKHFRKVGAFSVGPEAYKLLLDGKRLCASVKASSTIDLRLAPDDVENG